MCVLQWKPHAWTIIRNKSHCIWATIALPESMFQKAEKVWITRGLLGREVVFSSYFWPQMALGHGIILNLHGRFLCWPGSKRTLPFFPCEFPCLGSSLQPSRVFSALASPRKKENILMRTITPLAWAADWQRTFDIFSHWPGSSLTIAQE